MDNELQDLRNAGYKPVLVGPQPFSFEDILRRVDPSSKPCMNCSRRARLRLPQPAEINSEPCRASE